MIFRWQDTIILLHAEMMDVGEYWFPQGKVFLAPIALTISRRGVTILCANLIYYQNGEKESRFLRKSI